MKTTLPQAIATIEEAQAFLTELEGNGESFHPEDNAHNIQWHCCNPPTAGEADLLNKLMQDIYDLPGNDGRHIDLVFDPCEFLLMLDPDYAGALSNVDTSEDNEPEELFSLTQNGVEQFQGTEFECYLKLQHLQSRTASWAIKHEGWSIDAIEADFNNAVVLTTYYKNGGKHYECFCVVFKHNDKPVTDTYAAEWTRDNYGITYQK